jgi:hypothetical protein
MQALQARTAKVLHAVEGRISETLNSRKPLVRKTANKSSEVKLYNPRFEEDFVAGKDYDPDRCSLGPMRGTCCLAYVAWCISVSRLEVPCYAAPSKAV